MVLTHNQTSIGRANLKSRSNFLLSFLILPKKQRRALMNFYAFSRVVDDAVDESDDPHTQSQTLGTWRAQVLQMTEGRPTHPIIQATQKSFDTFHIPYRYLSILIEGCEMDIHHNSYQTFDDLYEYCWRVAGVVGIVCMHIFGANDEEAQQAAVHLGLALQLTNIIRDVKEDLARGRIYIPQEELTQFGVNIRMLGEEKPNPAFTKLMQFQAERAQGFFAKGLTYLQQHRELSALKSALMMARIYAAILEKIVHENFPVRSRRVSLSLFEKIRIFTAVLLGLIP